MKSIETNFLHKILLSAIFICSLGSFTQPALPMSKALVPFSKELVAVSGKAKDVEKSELIKQLEALRPEIARLLNERDEQAALKKEVLRVPRSLSGMWRRAKNNSVSSVRSAWNKVKSLGTSTRDAMYVGLISSTGLMSYAVLSGWLPSWVQIKVWPAAYIGFAHGVLVACGYYMWQYLPSSKYGAAHDTLLDLCQELGIPVEGLALKHGDGRNKICSKIYGSYNSNASPDERRGLIKALLLDAQADKDAVSNAFTKYRSQIDAALKKIKDVVTVKELRVKSFKLAALLCNIKEKMMKINTDLNAVK